MFVIPVLMLFSCINGGDTTRPANDLLRLESQIPLAGVHGRIDHLSYDPATHRLFVAALGNNSVEVVDLAKKERLHSIAGPDEPQGLCYLSHPDRLVVANGGSGDVVFYDGQHYTELGRIALKKDADNVRYNSSTQMIYVGYGSGGIAVIDPTIIKQLSILPLKGHPEAFQLDAAGRIFINVPDQGEILSADLATLTIRGQWKNESASANFPMAVDQRNGRLFIGYRHPASIKIIDSRTGTVSASMPCVGDTDDLFYDAADSLLLVSGGEGFIDAFRGTSRLSHIPTRKGARTSLWLPAERKLILAVPERGGERAAIWVYTVAGM